MKKNLLLAILMALPFFISSAAEEGSKVTFRPTARALFDAAAYAPSDSDFVAGVCCPDVRLGAMANFDNFEVRADISMRFGKFYPADIYLQWNINPHSFLKGGYFVHQFGLQSATGASHKIGMEEPIAQSALGELRLLGAMYVWNNAKLHFAGSLFGQSSSMTEHANTLGKSGFGAMARIAWHPMASTGNIFQVGATALMQSPNYSGDKHNPISTFGAQFPTKVSNVNCVSARVDEVKSIFKISPELLWSRGRWAAESQFYYMNVGRKLSLPSFAAKGAYVQGRVLLNRGAEYGYSAAPGYLATPRPGSWEIVAGWSWLDLDCNHAEIYGGRANSASLTLNYYLNKYITWRVNYNYTRRSSSAALAARDVNIFQTRIQFVF